MRKTIFKIHSYLALAAMVPILVVSITGSLLVYKTEIDQWLMPGVASLSYGGSSFGNSSYGERQPRTNLDRAIKTILAENPGFVLGSWELFNDGKEADRVYLIKQGTADWYKIYYDPFSNKVLSSPVTLSSDLTDWLLKLHYTFLLNDIGGDDSQVGTLVGVFVALVLTVLGGTGLVSHRHFWKRFFYLRWNKKTRIVLGDIHRLAGLWGSPVILVVGITGLYFNIVEYIHEAIEHGDEDHYVMQIPLHSDDIKLQDILVDSTHQLDHFTPTYLLFPYEPDHEITLFGYQPNGNPFASNYFSTVSYSKHDGEFLMAFDGREASAVTQIVDSFRELHFGSFAGGLSKFLWCVLGLTPVILALTGLVIWFSRRRSRHRFRNGARQSSSDGFRKISEDRS